MPSDLARRAHAVLEANRDEATRLVQRQGLDRTTDLLRAAQRSLEKRLKVAVQGPGEKSFTAARLGSALAQVRHVTAQVTRGLGETVVDAAEDAGEMSAEHTVDYLRAADRAYRGVGTTPLALRDASMLDAGMQGARASVLRRLAGDDEHPAQVGILKRYGLETVGHFERIMRVGLVAQKSWDEMQEDLEDASPFLRQAPAHWAARIVRTECLPGDTVVSGAVVLAAFRRRYQGDVFDIVTRDGRKFTATPNHPMLTRRGWATAACLEEGDDLICDDGEQNACAPRYENVQRGPSSLREIFDALAAIGVVERRRTAQPDFHGDGMDGEVRVARVDGMLTYGRFTPLDEHLRENLFARSGARTRDIRTDRIVSVERRIYSGDVYNLHTAHGYYAIGGVYTGNCMGAYGRSAQSAVEEADAQLGDMAKIWCETFDDRTAADSYACHGQVRLPEEEFETWYGAVMCPPMRPNDRAILIPHRIAWPIPAHLKQKSDAEVLAAWKRQGGKGAPPERPAMTTIPLQRFGAPPQKKLRGRARRALPPPPEEDDS
jgi:hypothetical protein